MARKKFIRRNWDKYKRLGKNNKKKQIWRRPKGRHSKTRERRTGYPSRPEMGMKKPASAKIKLARNISELQKMNHGEKVIVAKVGSKLRAEIERIAKEKGIKIVNERKNAGEKK